MNALRKAVRVLMRLLAALGLIVVLVVTTPVVSWWAQAYAGPLAPPKLAQHNIAQDDSAQDRIAQPQGDVLILLAAAADDHGGISYSSYWRARAALVAWQTGNFRQIVITGGGGPGIRDFLLAEGIPTQAMTAEWRSTSTRENAINTARLIAAMPGRKVLLTSDFHMFRALGAFRKLGIEVTPLAAPDVLHMTEHWNGRVPAFEIMLTESVKIVYYELRGWM